MLQVTKQCIACSKCPPDFGNGDGLYRAQPCATWPHAWVPPRGWAGSADSEHRPVMLVALNPGHPISGELAAYAKAGVKPYRDATEVEDSHALAILRHVTNTYSHLRRTQDSIFGRKCIAYIRCTAWILKKLLPAIYTFEPEAGEWYHFGWITDAFKCSTRRDTAPRIPKAHLIDCVNTHLPNEIRAARPRLVLALGGGSAYALERSRINWQSPNGPRFVGVRHPSQGCPPIDDSRHDASFFSIAEALGSNEPSKIAGDPEFTAFRTRVQRHLFPARRQRS
jgi:hypothetical protein